MLKIVLSVAKTPKILPKNQNHARDYLKFSKSRSRLFKIFKITLAERSNFRVTTSMVRTDKKFVAIANGKVKNFDKSNW